MTQKSIAVMAAAGVLSLTLGLGLGRMTAVTDREEAMSAYGLVDREDLASLEETLERRSQELDEAKALGEEASRRRSELEADVARLDAALRKEKDKLAAAEKKDELPAVPDLGVAFGEYSALESLRAADWKELAAAVVNMQQAVIEFTEKQKEGGPVDAEELQKKIRDENNKLVKLAVGVMGKIPTNSPINGEFTHPIITANLLSSVLDQAELGLTEEQRARISSLGEEFDEEYQRLQSSYGESTPRFQKLLDELSLKRDTMTGMRDVLTGEQREAAYHPELQDTALDILSPGPMTQLMVQPKRIDEGGDVRGKLTDALGKGFDLTSEQIASLGPEVDAWLRDVEPYLQPRSEDDPPRLDAQIASGRGLERVLRSALELPDLDASARGKILGQQGWFVPWVVRKK